MLFILLGVLVLHLIILILLIVSTAASVSHSFFSPFNLLKEVEKSRLEKGMQFEELVLFSKDYYFVFSCILNIYSLFKCLCFCIF